MMSAPLSYMASNIYVPPPHTANRKALVLSVLGLALFLAAEALLLRSFIRADTRPPAWDQSIHLEIALDYRQALKEGRFADAWFLPPKSGMPAFPPAYHLLLMRAYDSANPANAALWINWFYLTLLSVSIFGIAWRFRPDETALAAVILFVASPVVQDLLTTQLVDLPLVAVAAAAYWALLASDEFRRWTPALLFGFLHAAGMLHKWSFFSFMLPAYFIALRSLRDRRTAMIMLASAALSAAISVPWYSAHLALMPSRLVQASADFAIPVWSNPGAWLSYASQASNHIGPLVWLLGTIGLIAPQYRRNREQGWILLAWFATSYIFWTIVPNRQLRFLLPGLVPIAIAFCATWPKAVTWGAAALQLLVLFNFYGGWIGPVTLRLPFYHPQFFVNRPAAKEDWKTAEILRRIDAERDPSLPFSNVTVVANDAHFNGTTFNWMQRYLGLEHVRMRGVNRRLSELSEFVLLKDPKLGPPTVILGLPEASAEIRDPRTWFGKAYEEIARWPLPDSTNAILYRQRRGSKKPYEGNTLIYQHYTAGKVVIKDLKATFGPWDREKSVYKNMNLRVGQLNIRGLVLSGTDIDLVNVRLIPITKEREDDWVDIRLLRLERLRVKSLEVGADELKAFLTARVKGLRVDELTLDKTVRISGAFNGKPVSAEAGLRLLDAPRRLKIDIMSVRLAGVNVPLTVFREIKELNISLDPNPETPFVIDLPGLTIADGRLTVP